MMVKSRLIESGLSNGNRKLLLKLSFTWIHHISNLNFLTYLSYFDICYSLYFHKLDMIYKDRYSKYVFEAIGKKKPLNEDVV